MSNTLRYALLVCVANIVMLAIMIWYAEVFSNDMESALFIMFVIPGILVLAQFVAALALLIARRRQDLAKGIAAGLGLFLLIGLSVCGIAAQF